MHHAYALIVAALWGFYPFLLKIAYGSMQPIATWSIMTLTGAFAVLAAMAFYKPSFDNINFRDAMLCVLAGIMGPIAGCLMYHKMISYCDHVSLVVTLAFTAPLFAVLFGYLFFNQKLSLLKSVGVLVTIIGIAMVLI